MTLYGDMVTTLETQLQYRLNLFLPAQVWSAYSSQSSLSTECPSTSCHVPALDAARMLLAPALSPGLLPKQLYVPETHSCGSQTPRAALGGQSCGG